MSHQQDSGHLLPQKERLHERKRRRGKNKGKNKVFLLLH
jgi:hypothetical protein